MNITDNRAVTSVTVTRTSSLREPSRLTMKEDQAPCDNGSFSLNKRSLSNEKMSSDSMTPVFISQRGSSLRQNGKSAFPMSSPNSSNRHPFKIIKPIETSPRASESNIDTDVMSSLKMSSKVSLKFKHRPQVQSSGGPLVPDHSLMKEPTRDNILFTPRPPLVKKFSSDQEDPSSDIDCGLTTKNSRYSQLPNAPRPPISPTRGASQAGKCTNIESSIEKKEKDISDDDTSELDDNHNSDCETPPPTNGPTEAVVCITKHRSSLRKGSDSPNQSDVPGRASPSPTKTVKWNMNTEVKKIPRSRSLNGKMRYSKSKYQRSGADRNTKLLSSEQRLVESHEHYISSCTSLIRTQVSLLENLRNEKISVSHYKRDLVEFLDQQKKLVTSLQSLMSEEASDQDKAASAVVLAS